MSERAPYSRLYWSLIDDPKFATIYDDDRAFAWWVRLLMIADQAHPASAHVPSGIPRRTLSALEDVGLVVTTAGGRFRITGLDAERERRRLAASRPDGTQPGPKQDPDGLRTTGLSLAEPSKDEPSLADAGARDAATVYADLTGHWPNEKARRWVDDLVGRYGHDRVGRALALASQDDPSARTLIGRAQERLEGKKPPRYGLRPGSPEYELAKLMAEQEATA